MNASTSTGPASQSAPSDQGQSAISNVNPFESAPPSDSTNAPVEPASTQPGAEPAGTAPAAAPAAGQPPAQPSINLTADDLRKSIVDGIVAAQQKTAQPAAAPAQPPRQMSPEEFRAHYRIPNVDAGVYKAMLGVDPQSPEQVKALDNLLQGFMHAGLRMGQDLYSVQLEQFKGEFTQQLTPLQQHYQQQYEAGLQQGFLSKHPDLANEMATVNEVRDAMIARGVKFSSVEEMYNQVGTATRQLLTRIRGSAPAGGQSQPGSSPAQPQSRPQPRTMTPASAGGRGGTGGSGQNSKSTAEAVFGS